MQAKLIVLLTYLLTATCFAARNIPHDLLLGTATAAYQIEGAWNEDGKGPSIWDDFLHKKGGENGDVACDSYHKWQEDVEHVKQLGLDSYRFSIAWARILPDGTLNSINQKGVDYYLNLIKALKEANVEPLVTIYHFDMPQHIGELGGFLNPQFVDYFGDFARLVYSLYAPYVKYWFTFNEPLSICDGGYGTGKTAPGLPLSGEGSYQCSYVLLKAHAQAYRIYQEEFKPKYHGKVGIVLSTNWYEPLTNTTEDIEAQERVLQFQFGWWAHPVFVGNWPKVMIDRIANRSALEGFSRSRLPQFTQEEIDYINGTHDFMAFNSYQSREVQNAEYPISYPNYNFDIGAHWSASNWTVHREGLRKLISYVNEKLGERIRYRPGSIIITENGLGVDTGDSLDDENRIAYVKGYLNAVLDAIELDKVNVFGYTVWSLMDNFEWGSYRHRFGLISVDFTSANRTRTWKKSAEWYRNVTTARQLDD